MREYGLRLLSCNNEKTPKCVAALEEVSCSDAQPQAWRGKAKGGRKRRYGFFDTKRCF